MAVDLVAMFGQRSRWADPAASRPFTGVKLLPDMPGSLDRYLVPDQRDFFAVTLR